MTQFIHSNALGLAAADQFTHSIPFQYTVNVTKDDLMENSNLACQYQVQIQTGVGNYLKTGLASNWVHVTRLN